MDLADLVAAVIRRLARERIVQFVAIAVLVFAFAHRPPRATTTISLSHAYIASLDAAQAQRIGVASLPEARELEVERRAIEDEVLYREALRLGLDRDDAVVRQHLVQKMLLLAEDLGGASQEPTSAEIAAYFERTRQRWQLAESVHFVHVFATRRDTLLALTDTVRAAPVGTPPALGDAFPRSRDVTGSHDDLAATYGDELADAVSALPTGSWSEPIASRYGWHLVFVVARTPGRPAALAEVADKVRLELSVERRHAAIARFLERAAGRYTIVIDGAPVRDYQPTSRIALRSQPSAED